MIEKGMINARQMAILGYSTIIATAILSVPAITGKYAEQDMWLSPIWSSLVGFLTFFVIYRLGKHYPNETIIEFSGKIIGAIPGKIIGFIILIFTWYTASLALRDYGDFVVGQFLTLTPMVVVLGSMAFICAFAVHGGLETMARSAQIFVPVILILLLFVFILLLPDLDPENMLPIMENGITPSMKGAFAPGAWFSEVFLISFMLPYINKKGKKLKWGVIIVLAVLFTLIMSNLFTLFVFGSITPSFTYPAMTAARYISVADFLEHMESIIMAIWITGVFIKTSVFLYAIVLGTAQWLHLSDYKPVVFPITFLVVLGSIWSGGNIQEISHTSNTSWSFLTYIVYLLLPAFLLLVSFIRRKINKQQK